MERIVLRKRLVDSRGIEVFWRNCFGDEGVNGCIAVPKKSAVGCGIEPQIFRGVGCHGNCDRETGSGRVHIGCARLEAWDIVNRGRAQGAPQTFIVKKEEGFILYDRASNGDAELILTERRYNLSVKIIASIQRVVPKEFIDAAMKLICACPRNCVDDTASFATILCRRICGYD